MAIETARPKFKRKQYLVAKKFQLKYVGLILLLMFLTAALCSYVVYYTSMLMMGAKLANVYPQGRLLYIVKAVNFRILLSVILVTPLVGVMGIFLSHRIAGPIYRMEKFLRNMADGDFSSRLVLRQNDELKNLADGINYLSDSLKSTITSYKASLNKVAGELERLKKSSSPNNDNINRLESELKSLSKELERYKL